MIFYEGFKVWKDTKMLHTKSQEWNAAQSEIPWFLAQSCKLNNQKYMIALIQITNTEIFAFIAVLVFTLFSRNVLFINRKDNRNC